MQLSHLLLAQAVASCAYAYTLPSTNHTTSTPKLTTKTLLTTSGYKYTYDHVPASNASQPTVLLLHGFPASRHDWEHTIPALTAQGYGVIAPDLLGFGDTDAPAEIEAYNLKDVVAQLGEILDAEVEGRKVVGVCHDIGCNVLGRAAAWAPERFARFVFITVSYSTAGLFLDVDAINSQSLETRGYAQLGYWYFFNSWDAAAMLARNLESFFSLAWGTPAADLGTTFGDIGVARAYLAANTTLPSLPSWVTSEYKARWLDLYARPDAFVGPLNYYKALMRGVYVEDEKVLTDEDRMLKVPVLAIGSGLDTVSTADLQRLSLERWVDGEVEQRVVEAGHWILQEQGEEVNAILGEFIGRE